MPLLLHVLVQSWLSHRKLKNQRHYQVNFIVILASCVFLFTASCFCFKYVNTSVGQWRLPVVATPGNKKFCPPPIRMAQLPQNTIVIYDQNSKTMQGWHKHQHSSRKQKSLPHPSVKGRSMFKNFITINNTKFPDTDETIIILQIFLFTLSHNRHRLLPINGYEMYKISVDIYLNLIGKGETVVKLCHPRHLLDLSVLLCWPWQDRQRSSLLMAIWISNILYVVFRLA